MQLGLYDGLLPANEEAFSSLTKIGGQAVFTQPSTPEAQVECQTAIQGQITRTCGRCGDPLFLIAQCYCPIPNPPETSAAQDRNRMLYVFACNKAECCRRPSEGSWRAYSVLLNEEDPLLLAEEQEEQSRKAATSGTVVVTTTQSTAAPPSSFQEVHPFSFPSFAIQVEPEPEKEEVVPTKEEQKVMDKYEAKKKLAEEEVERERIQKKYHPEDEMEEEGETKEKGEENKKKQKKGGGGASLSAEVTQKDVEEFEENIDTKNKPIDIWFEKFRRRIARAPTQVFRYQRDGVPLFMNPEATVYEHISPCRHCGSRRMMEIQIISTSLFYLKPEQFVSSNVEKQKTTGISSQKNNEDEDDGKKVDMKNKNNETTKKGSGGEEGLDFATVTVYVCSKDCRLREKKKKMMMGKKSIDDDQNVQSDTKVEVSKKTVDGEEGNALPVILIEEEYVMVEPAPSLETEAKYQDKMTFREAVLGPEKKP